MTGLCSTPNQVRDRARLQGGDQRLPEAFLVEKQRLDAAFAVDCVFLLLLLLGVIRLLRLLGPLLLSILRGDDDFLQVRLQPEQPAHLTNLACEARRLGTVEANLILMVLFCHLAQLCARPALAAPEPGEDLARALDNPGYVRNF